MSELTSIGKPLPGQRGLVIVDDQLSFVSS